MGRIPRHYSIWATIIKGVEGQYVVTVSAITNDTLGETEREGESATAATLADAQAKRLEMVRAMASRLQGGGNMISAIDMHLDSPES